MGAKECRLVVVVTGLVLLGAPASAGTAADQKAVDLAAEYESAIERGHIDNLAQRLISKARTPSGTAELEAAASALATSSGGAADVVRRVARYPSPLAPSVAAELLWRIAVKGRLPDELAAVAGELLADDDPFVAALAEWAIATRVGMDNGGQEIVWPRDDPPDWFERWRALGPEFLTDADYARLAVVWNVHRDPQKLLASVGKIIERARGAASEVLVSGSASSEETRAMVARQLDRLESIRREMAAWVRDRPEEIVGSRRLWLAARRAARPIVLANPAVNFRELLFVKRFPAHSHRNITGSQYPWVHKPGGDLSIQTGLEPGGEVRSVLRGQLGPGHVHGMDLAWNANRVVFAYARQPKWPPEADTVLGNDVFLLRAQQEPTHIYQINADGTGLVQVTDDPYWSDLEPTYAAGGDIVFASDRSGRSSECGKFSADHTVINIYAVSPDGTNLRRLSDNKDIDRYPHSLDNGLIGYTRWEYQERHFLEVHSFWTVRPDGTMADAVFNQHLKAPYGLRDTRSIPGGHGLVSIATGHHTFAYGPVVVIDPGRGPNSPGSIKSVTPHTLPEEGPPPGEAVAEGGVPDLGGLYQTPWALSEKCFLVSYSHARPASGTQGENNAGGFALYLIDVYGNKELIHRDLLYSCSFPIPFRPRPRPPVLPRMAALPRMPAPPETADRAGATATCFVGDVYGGMEGIVRGTVKYLRISQRVGWPLDEKVGAMRYIPGNAWEKHFGFWAWAPVRVIGTAPVEADGSACFRVPAERAVYFQALDENYMEVRRMRSHISFQPGEVRGCVGCHESRPETPSTAWRSPLAAGREPAVPEPPSWGSEKLLGYEWMIQPILDRRCVGCHGGEEPDGGIDLTSARTEDGFYRSFATLFGRTEGSTKAGPALVSISNRFDGAAVSRPKQFGSHRSPLVRVLLDDRLHREEAQLEPEEWIALVTWVDANAPYYDRFYNRRPENGDGPRRDVVMRDAAR